MAETRDHFQLKMVVTLYTTILVLGSLQAFSLFGIPYSWLSLSAVIPLGCLSFYFFRDTTETTGTKLIVILLLWLVIASALNRFGQFHETIFSPDSSTPYWRFVSLRFFSIISFALFLYSLSVLFNQGLSDRIIATAMAVGVLASVYALYSYHAQLYGLPEFRHNRDSAFGSLGEKIMFSYAFHRALGSFLEPGTLAAFLIVPFFCSMSSESRIVGNVAATVILATIFLTGSLTGILSIFLGIVVTSFFWIIQRKSVAAILSILLRLCVIAVLSIVIFKVLVHPYKVNTSFEAPSAALSPVANNLEMNFMVIRISRLMASGLEHSNRGYVYKALRNNPPPLIGFGLGAAYLALGKMLGENTVVSFLNLYLNILYSGGLIALLALLVFLAFPIVRVLKNKVTTNNPLLFYAMSAYIAWLATYFSLYDEFNLMSAIPYSILVFLSKPGPTLPREGL